MTLFATEERNIARLSLVVAFNRIASGMVGWQKIVQIDHLSPINMTCIARQNHVVPHGIDNDVLFALTTLYVFQGQPESGCITVSVKDLCRTAGLEPGGTTFQRIRESLQRWLHVTYHVTDCWAAPTKNGNPNFRSLSFEILSSVQPIDFDVKPRALGERFEPSPMLQITLSRPLIESMAAGYVRRVNMEFYASLRSPLSRMLYRTLEEQRALLGVKGAQFSTRIVSWGDHLGLRVLTNSDPTAQPETGGTSLIPVTEVLSATRIRRALTPAHDELRQNGYLKSVDAVGQGRNQRLDYWFGAPVEAVDLELVALLVQRFVSPKQAEHYVRTCTRQEVETAVAQYDARRNAGDTPRNLGTFIASLLAHRDKTPEP